MESIVMQVARDADCADIDLPAYQSEAASGMDVRAAVKETLVIASGQTALVPTGLRIAVPTGYEVQVRPRSGLALKHGITVLNTPGTIDADYRGPVGVILANLGCEPFAVERGARIAQLVVQAVTHVRVEAVGSLDETARGEGGFGSSGTH